VLFRSNEEPIIRSDGTPERDYIYLSDAVDGYLRAAAHAPGYPGHAFNLGTARAVSALALVRQILDLAGNPGLRPRILREASGEIDRQCLAADKARRLLGWEPAVALGEGLRWTIEWYRRYLALERAPALQEVTA